MNSSVNSTSEENKKIGNLEDRLVKTSRTKTKEGMGWEQKQKANIRGLC